jgi:CDP-2,3-bis-(O-geranylgeranyl)-sn-glycerol synthase
VDYQVVSVVGFGLALGLGSLIGDLVKSFFKRQLGVAPGKAWIPFDQIDWILGALVALSFFIGLTVSFVVVSLILFGILHIIANQIGYYLKINKEKF